MPFTISHAGFLLPLRGCLSAHLLLAAMLGSMVPDFGYFIREFGLATAAHTLGGAVWISLPVGLLLYVLTIACFRRVVCVFPTPHSEYLATLGLDRCPRGRTFALVAFATLLGAWSHNFVDSFSHESGRAVAMFSFLRSEIFVVAGESFQTFRLVQYGGSALGMVMIVWVYCRGVSKYCRTQNVHFWQDGGRWVKLFAIAVLTGLVAACLQAGVFAEGVTFFALRAFAFRFLITWLPLLGGVFLCYALFPRPGIPSTS